MTHVRHGIMAGAAHVADCFEAQYLGAPFKVVLHEAVTVVHAEDGSILKYTIPDPDGLYRSIAFKRLVHPRKLSGEDVRFLRKALGIRQKQLAEKIEVSPEHLSRCEKGVHPLSPTSEKLLRVYALKTAFKLHKVGASAAKTKLEDALDSLFDAVKVRSAHSANDELEFHFWLQSVTDEEESNLPDSPEWLDEPKPRAA